MASSTYLRPEFVDPRSGFSTPFDQNTETAGLKATTTYFNNLSSRVTVALRNGVKFEVPPQSNIKLAREFVVRQEYVFNKDVTDSLNRVLNSIVADQNVTLRLIRENMTDGFGERFGSKKTILEYAISETAINDAGGKLYLHDLDVAIGIPSRYDYLIHPYSIEGRDMDISTYQGKRDEKGFSGIDIEYVTCDSNQRPLYTRFSDKIIAIMPNLNMHQPAGLYIRMDSIMESPGSSTVPKVIMIEAGDFEEMEKYGFFRTYEQAAHGPSFELAQKQKLTTKQAEIDELKLALSEANLRLEQEKAGIKREQMRNEALASDIKLMTDSFKGYQDHHLGNEERRRKTEHDFLKEDYEYRSLRRKEESELIKYLPSIIVGIGTIFMAIKTLAANSK